MAAPSRKPALVAALNAVLSMTTWAAPLVLGDTPAQVYKAQPAPNVLVTLDDSSSMQPKWAQLKSAVNTGFSEASLPNHSVRLAWQSLHRCAAFGSSSLCGGDNRIKDLDAAHRSAFFAFLEGYENYTYLAGTPTQKALSRVNDYLSGPVNLNSPWAAAPGSALSPVLSCRRNYHIVMTDGAWTNHPVFFPTPVGNSDGTGISLPDGTAYNPLSSASRVYRDNASNTVADYAFHGWATDLQPSLANDVAPWQPVAGNETFGSTTLAPYWNPRNDPANWQHVNTFAIAFQTDPASSWLIAPPFQGDMYGDVADIISGALSWPTPNAYGGDEDPQKIDMWHAALNGRGGFIPATSAQALTQAFQDILSQIQSVTSTTLTTSITVAAGLVRANAQLFNTYFSSGMWSGDLQAWAFGVDSETTTAQWSAADALGATQASSRAMLTHNGSEGTVFQWANLSTNQRAALRASPSLLQYLRLDRSGEIANGGTYRDRSSALGDIVHSKPWVTGAPQRRTTEYSGHATFRDTWKTRPSVVYVGANDGALHGFDSSTGAEVLAYVPRGAYAHLAALSDPSYRHRYFVDGPVFTGDAHNGNDWHTALVGTMGRGGKGYFVLDVTRGEFATKATIADGSDVLIDTTDGSDEDIGYITTAAAPPADDTHQSSQIVRLNNGRWAALLGNGVNSTSERAVLIIQYLDGERERHKLIPDATGFNGLGAPATLDVNGDGTVDKVYAGDAQGHLWRFDLEGSDEATWAPMQTALFQSTDPSALAQPIWAAPVVARQIGQGAQIVFATGQRLTQADETNGAQQSLYSLHDDLSTEPSSPYSRADLQADVTGVASSGGQIYYQANTSLGWLLDWSQAQERVVDALTLTQDNNVIIDSVVPGQPPDTEGCGNTWGSDAHYLTVLHAVQAQALLKTGEINRFSAGAAAAAFSTPGQTYLVTDNQQNLEVNALNTSAIRPDLRRARRVGWRQLFQ
jgi:type IV pilus assembly protein PilY1